MGDQTTRPPTPGEEGTPADRDAAEGPQSPDAPLLTVAEGRDEPKRTMADSAPTTTTGRMAEWVRHNRGRGALEIGIIFLLVQAACITAYFIWPDQFPYLSSANLNVITQSVPVIGLLAIAAGILMVSGEFDLSIGSMFTMCGLVFLTMYGDGNHAVLAFTAAILLGICIALINGFITVQFQIPSFIVTLGAMMAWNGIALWYTGGGSAIIQRGPVLETVFTGNIFGIRGQLFWLIGVGVVFWFVMHRHRLGNHIFAVGGNKAAAQAISINPKKIKLISFAILGALVALAAVLSVVRVESMTPGTGRGLELRAIAAAVVGGASLRGGKGSVLGMVLGAALIFTVQDVLLLLRAPGFYIEMFVGMIIVVAAVFNRLIEGKAQ